MHRVRAVLDTGVGDGTFIVARLSLRHGRVRRAEHQGEGECADPSSGRRGHVLVLQGGAPEPTHLWLVKGGVKA